MSIFSGVFTCCGRKAEDPGFLAVSERPVRGFRAPSVAGGREFDDQWHPSLWSISEETSSMDGRSARELPEAAAVSGPREARERRLKRQISSTSSSSAPRVTSFSKPQLQRSSSTITIVPGVSSRTFMF